MHPPHFHFHHRLVALAAAALATAGFAVSAAQADASTQGSLSSTGVLTLTGTSGADTVALRANVAVKPARLDVDTTGDGVADLKFPVAKVKKVIVQGSGGDDALGVVPAGAGVLNAVPMTFGGGAGKDTITGGAGPDKIFAGDDNDIVTPSRGSDETFLGSGADKVLWGPNDGSDVIEGEAGSDRLVAWTGNDGDDITLARNGSRVLLSHTAPSTIVVDELDLDDVERVDAKTGAFGNLVTIGDLTGTNVTKVQANLVAASEASPTFDEVIVNGTELDDRATISSADGTSRISGLHAEVTVIGADPVHDQIAVQGNGSADVLDATTVPAGAPTIALFGGEGDDDLFGGAGRDILVGENGDDGISTREGDDFAHGGPGADNIAWFAGDGNDEIRGGEGNDDSVGIVGSNAAEVVSYSAADGGLVVTRDLDQATVSVFGAEAISHRANFGADTIRVHDLGGSGVLSFIARLGSFGPNNGDGAADEVVLEGTPGFDVMSVAGSGHSLAVSGALPSGMSLEGSDGVLDTLRIETLGGDDVVGTSLLAAGTIGLVVH